MFVTADTSVHAAKYLEEKAWVPLNLGKYCFLWNQKSSLHRLITNAIILCLEIVWIKNEIEKYTLYTQLFQHIHYVITVWSLLGVHHKVMVS